MILAIAAMSTVEKVVLFGVLGLILYGAFGGKNKKGGGGSSSGGSSSSGGGGTA